MTGERMADAAQASLIGRALPRARLVLLADLFAAGVAAALPWSTTATWVMLVLWLLALAPTLNRAMLWRELRTPAGGLPVLLWLLALAGLLWAAIPFAERVAGLGG